MKLAEYFIMKNLIEKDRHDWIVKQKMSLLLELVFMRIAQLFSFTGVLMLYTTIWYFCTESDVLYLIGWWIITGAPISMLLWCYLDIAIKRYKKTSIKKIHRVANQKFKDIKFYPDEIENLADED